MKPQQQPSPVVAAALERAARTTGVPLGLLRAVAWVESSFNPRAVGPETHAGKAKGLMQLVDVTARDLGVVDPFDPAMAALAAANYLDRLHRRFGSWPHAIAGYNWGPANVSRTAQWPEGVRGYVQKVMARWRLEGGAPPVAASDASGAEVGEECTHSCPVHCAAAKGRP